MEQPINTPQSGEQPSPQERQKGTLDPVAIRKMVDLAVSDTLVARKTLAHLTRKADWPLLYVTQWLDCQAKRGMPEAERWVSLDRTMQHMYTLRGSCADEEILPETYRMKKQIDRLTEEGLTWEETRAELALIRTRVEMLVEAGRTHAMAWKELDHLL